MVGAGAGGGSEATGVVGDGSGGGGGGGIVVEAGGVDDVVAGGGDVVGGVAAGVVGVADAACTSSDSVVSYTVIFASTICAFTFTVFGVDGSVRCTSTRGRPSVFFFPFFPSSFIRSFMRLTCD